MPTLVTRGAASVRGFGFAGTTPVLADPYFNYTTLLLHGNGTNGGQNNTFLDSGTANGGVGFDITRNGNTTQGTFSPFSQTGWSNYFDGTGDYLQSTLTGQTFGTGDFTVEFWVKFDSIANTGILDTRVSGDSSSTWCVQIYNNNLSWEGSGVANLSIPTSQLQLSTWMHFAYTRVSGVMRVYMNGVQYGSTASVTNNYTSTRLDIGGAVFASISWLSGYMSNVRLVKGSAVYTGNFTPPTAPLTAISGTVFLSCQSNRFIDNSSSAFSISVGGTPSVQAFSPFAPTAAYSASTVGGSGYFDGSGDFLSTPSITVGSNNFTFECWVYPSTSQSGNPRIFEIGGDNNDYFLLQYTASTTTLILALGTGGGGTTVCSTTISFAPAAWTHIAVVREGTGSNQVKMYINGVNVSTGTSSASIPGAPAYVGGISWASPYHWNGYISSARLVVGTAVYTANFTPPTAPLAAITNTQLLLNFTNAAIIDNTAKNDLETVGNAQISTTQSKFGGGSILCSTSSDYLRPPNSLSAAMSTGDFTIEFWFYASSLTTFYQPIIDTRNTGASATGFFIGLDASGKPDFYTNGADRCLNASAISTGQWYHIAVCRASGSTRLFINGVQGGSTYTDANNYSNQQLRIGTNFDASLAMSGYIDDLRITKGIARYTSNFTPQTSQWQDQ